MSKYTIEVYSLLKDKNFKLFDFDYDFYTDNQDIKQSFESKFIDTYLFNEIGHETVARFKHFLKRRLNNIMPYYKQLYETELRTKDIDFMLNKDLTEIFERTNTSNKSSQTDTNSENNITNKDVSNLTNNSTDNAKESYLEQGLANISVDDKLTGVTLNKSDINQNSTTDTVGSNKSVGSSKSTDSATDKETTKLISQGNIGVTSSAELLEKWRKILINIDMLIIEECADLFMQVY